MSEALDFEDVSQFRRSPAVVMRLARMGCAHPTRLSFLRVLLRRVKREGWTFDRPVWDVNAQGVGRAVYRAKGPVHTYSLVAFAHDLPPEMRTDRVIATAWDATFTLFDGDPTKADLDRLEANVPLQESGRIGSSELCLSRANRSVRLFRYVIDCLAAGTQPDADEINAVGYLMRTTAVYGSGKFGAADREKIAERPELKAPFQAEMLSVWLIREFTVDIVEHLAAAKGGATAVRLDPGIKRSLGVGNSTGLGMAPFLVRHPKLVDHWMQAREEALARVRAQQSVTAESLLAFRKALDDARSNAEQWHSEHPLQVEKLADLRADLEKIAGWLEQGHFDQPHPWNALWLWGAEHLTLEGQEALISLLLEPHGDLVDGLTDCMSADETSSFRIDGSVSIAAMRALLKAHYGWVLRIDFDDPRARARFWYVSEEKLEPRLGNREGDAGAEREQPLGTAWLARRFFDALADQDSAMSLAEFLLAHPEHRYMARRAQITARYPFAEVQDNLTSEAMLPIDLLRCKLAFFGASRFDPRSDKWVRISLFQNQPYPSDFLDARA